MVCPGVKATTACNYLESCTVGTVWVASKLGGRKEGNEYCSPETAALREAVRRIFAERRPGHFSGKTEVLWEETAKCTIEAAWVWVLASRERFSEITTGRS